MGEETARDQGQEHDMAPTRGRKKAAANRDGEDVYGEPDDYEHRRKLQNRLAQRRYRKKLRQRLEKQLSEEPDRSTAAEEQQPEDKATSKPVSSCSDVVPTYPPYEFDAGVTFDSTPPLLSSTSLSDNPNVWGFPESLGGSPGVSAAEQAFSALSTTDYGLWHTMNHLIGNRLASNTSSLSHSALESSALPPMSSPSDNNEPQPRRSVTASANNPHIPTSSTSGRKLELHEMPRTGSTDDWRREAAAMEELRIGNSRRKKKDSSPMFPRGATCSCNHDSREHSRQRPQQFHQGRRAQSSSDTSTHNASLASSYRKRLNKRASEMIAELGQLYKVGVSLEMLRYDSCFVKDLAIMRERFVKLSESCHSDSPRSEGDTNMSGDTMGLLENRPDFDPSADKLDFDNFNLFFPLTGESSSGTDVEKDARSRSSKRPRGTTSDHNHGRRSYVDGGKR